MKQHRVINSSCSDWSGEYFPSDGVHLFTDACLVFSNSAVLVNSKLDYLLIFLFPYLPMTNHLMFFNGRFFS